MTIKLLTTGNPKVAKGQANGYLTNILHLAPSRMSGYNTCPMATAGCAAACLNTAGRGGLFAGHATGVLSGEDLVQAIMDGKITNKIQLARIARTKFFFEDRAAFMKQLVREVKAAIKRARKYDLTPVFRLNGTSDIRWETIPVTVTQKGIMQLPIDVTYPNIMTMFPMVQWYDYTKIANRRDLPANYHLTFSLAESNLDNAKQALRNGMNVAAVFRKVPRVFLGHAVMDGDATDLRFLDPKPVIVGLTAKGKAKKDQTGFVQN
jgi:hypothetical protein